MTDEQLTEHIRRYNDGMQTQSAEQLEARAREQMEGIQNASLEMISSVMLAQASMNFWRQEGPFTQAPIQMPPPTMLERIKRWLLA